VQFELLMASVHGQSAPDFTQAQAVLDLLGSCRAGTASTVAMEKAVSLPGTGLAIAKLVIQQQNISRRVSAQQYLDVL
jgi:hypothetical protein